MIEISHRKPDSRLSKYIRKITVFESKRKINYKQKLTPSAFTYFSYNHKSIPTSIFGNKRVKPDQRLQIAGPKINEEELLAFHRKLVDLNEIKEGIIYLRLIFAEILDTYNGNASH